MELNSVLKLEINCQIFWYNPDFSPSKIIKSLKRRAGKLKSISDPVRNDFSRNNCRAWTIQVYRKSTLRGSQQLDL